MNIFLHVLFSILHHTIAYEVINVSKIHSLLMYLSNWHSIETV